MSILHITIELPETDKNDKISKLCSNIYHQNLKKKKKIGCIKD